jgi:lipopolysaccharide export system permease protein
MRLISRHILRSLLAPFFWGVIALTGLLLLNSLPPLIDGFGGKGLPARIMVEGVLLFLPALFSLTLPMAVLVSVLYGYSQMAAALEMVAMYANGLSVWRMARPALVGAAFIAVVNFLVFDQVMPRSNVRFNDLRTAAVQTTPTLALQQQVLNLLPPSAYVLRAESIDPATSAMLGVTIFDLTGYTGNRRLIVADSGSMSQSENRRDLILTLHSGVIYEYQSDKPGQLQQTTFVHNRVRIENVQNQFDLNKGRLYRGEKEMSSCELLDGITDRTWQAKYHLARSEYYTRADLRALSGLPPVMPPAEQQQPKAPEHCGAYRRVEGWFKRLILPQKLAAQSPARVPVQNPVPNPPPAPAQQATAPAVMQTQGQQFLVPPPGPQAGARITPLGAVTTTGLMLGDARKTIRRYRVEFHQKIATPLASFCFVLIGMALAIKYPQSGIGLVIGGSLVIFLGFYILLQAGRGIAIAGDLDPAIALYAPLVLFTIGGVLAVNSADREMGTARSAGVFATIADFFRRLKD